MFPISVYQVEGESMLPNFKPGSLVITLNWFKKLNPSDCIIAYVNNKKILKRIKEIKNGKVYLLGDNKEASTDSVTFGWINQSDIIAKVLFKL